MSNGVDDDDARVADEARRRASEEEARARAKADRVAAEADRVVAEVLTGEAKDEGLRQLGVIYGGLIGVAVVMVQPFLAATTLDTSARVSVIAFAVAIPARLRRSVSPVPVGHHAEATFPTHRARLEPAQPAADRASVAARVAR
ncbi:MAG: hypothetical protein ABWY81_02260 [Jiangellaceae bacterium]